MTQPQVTAHSQTQAMIEVAGEFLTPVLNGTVEDFQEALTEFCAGDNESSMQRRMLVAAGLLKAGFSITTNPEFSIDPPEGGPDKAIDQGLLIKNWYRYEGAIIELGIMATDQKRFPDTYSREIVDFVSEEIK